MSEIEKMAQERYEQKELQNAFSDGVTEGVALAVSIIYERIGIQTAQWLSEEEIVEQISREL